VSRARIAELQSKVVPVVPRGTLRPGLPSPQELVQWMNSKMKKNSDKIQPVVGEDCYAFIRVQSALKYLRVRFFEKGLRTLEQVQSELKGEHWAFYTDRLKWLAGLGVDPSSTWNQSWFVRMGSA